MTNCTDCSTKDKRIAELEVEMYKAMDDGVWLGKRLAVAQATIARLVEALNWILHTQSGVSRSGEEPTQEEVVAALDSGKEALAAAKPKQEGKQ